MIDKIGGYKISEKLGEGGFGTVYKAVADGGEVVAIKLLNPEMLESDRVLQKFLDEAMILASIEHKNITNFKRLVKEGDKYAIIMEFVEGITLKDLLHKKGVINYEQGLNIVKQILEAFQFAHSKNIIHRDIKPANIMVDKKGNIKIMDFGIAKMTSTASHGTSKWGTYHYTAPERFKTNAVIDARSDIYSLGIMFYEMFTGRKPFESDDTARIIYCQVNETPVPPIQYAKISDHVNQAIMTSLEKDPTGRFSNCSEFSKALGLGYIDTDATVTSFAVDEIIARPKIWKKRQFLISISTFMILLIISIGIYFNYQKGEKVTADIRTETSEVSEKKAGAAIPSEPAVEEKRGDREIAKLYSDKAVEAYSSGETEVALKYAEDALKYNKNSVDAISVIGAIYYERGNYKKALELFNKAKSIKPEDEDIQAWIDQIREEM